MRAVYIFEPSRQNCCSCSSQQKSTYIFEQSTVLFLPHFPLVSFQRLQPPTSHQARGAFSLCCNTKHGLMIHCKSLRLGYAPVQLGTLCASQEKSPAAGSAFVLVIPFRQKGPEVTLRRVPGPKPQSQLLPQQSRTDSTLSIIWWVG